MVTSNPEIVAYSSISCINFPTKYVYATMQLDRKISFCTLLAWEENTTHACSQSVCQWWITDFFMVELWCCGWHWTSYIVWERAATYGNLTQLIWSLYTSFCSFCMTCRTRINCLWSWCIGTGRFSCSFCLLFNADTICKINDYKRQWKTSA